MYHVEFVKTGFLLLSNQPRILLASQLAKVSKNNKFIPKLMLWKVCTTVDEFGPIPQMSGFVSFDYFLWFWVGIYLNCRPNNSTEIN